MKRVLVHTNTIVLVNDFTQKMLESLDSMHSSNSYLKINYIILPEVERIHTKLWILLQFSSGLQGTKEQKGKITISYVFYHGNRGRHRI